jgi:uncharacterized protein
MDLLSLALHDILQMPERHLELSERVIDDLVDRGHLTYLSADAERQMFIETATAIHEGTIATALNGFWVMPTYMCNLRCPYCFQKHSLHRGENGFDKVLTRDQLPGLFEALDQLGGSRSPQFPRKRRYITLFGGEPLMAATESIVKELVPMAREREYKVGAITNALELDRFETILGTELIRWIQVTLDGPSEVQERQRPSANRIPSFEVVCCNISLALDKGTSVSLRTNVDVESFATVDQVQQIAERRGWTRYPNFSWNIAPIEKHVNRSRASSALSPFSILSSAIESKKVRNAVPHRKPIQTVLKGLMHTSLGASIQTAACGSHSGMYLFDAFENVYSCSEQVGDANFRVGNFRNGKLSLDRDLVEIWQGRHVGSVDECSRCAYAFFCGGGCANAARLETGSMMAPRCFTFQNAFDHVAVEVVDELINANIVQMGHLDMLNLNSSATLMTGMSAEDYAVRCLDELAAR